MTVIKKRIMTLTTLPKEDEKNDLEASLLNDENRSQTKSDSENGENLDSVPLFEIEKEEVEKKIVSLSRLLRLANSEWKIGIVAMIALLISTAATVSQPYFFGLIVTTSTGNTDESRRNVIYYTVFLLIILIIGGIFTVLRGWCFGLIGERIVRNIRVSLFEKITTLDISFFDENNTGDLVSRLTSDTAAIQSCLSVNVSIGLRSLAQVLISIIILGLMSWKLTLVLLGIVPILLLVSVGYGRYTKKLSKDYQDALAAAAESASESMSNARIMRAYSSEEMETSRYKNKIEISYMKGAILVDEGELKVGALTSFILYSIYITTGLAAVADLYSQFMNALGASDRIFQIIDMKPLIPVTGGKWLDYGAKPPPSIADEGYLINVETDKTTPPTTSSNIVQAMSSRGDIVFNNVVLRYPTRLDITVLKGFCLTIKLNQTVALVGASGAGKTSVLSLLERFYDVSEGSITIDGTDIRDLDPRWLHHSMAIVPQEPILFSGTIRSNISYAKRACNKCNTVFNPLLKIDDNEESKFGPSLEAIIRAAKQAYAHDFIMSFPKGYDTVVGERGVKLSGGQKQRLALARAFLFDPMILLLDEATSALDSESEQMVQLAINNLMANRTVILIAHRLSTIKNADVIAVVAEGRVVEQGSHKELLSHKDGLYSKLVNRQLERVDMDPIFD